MPARHTSLLLLVLLLFPAPARAREDFGDEAKVRAFVGRLAETRQVVDRAVICFDEGSFLRELSKWDEKRFWPVLLWDSDLVPKFLSAFRPKRVLLAKLSPDRQPPPGLDEALRAVAAAWGADAGGLSPRAFLRILASRKRAPLGVVLLSQRSPELLGGAALAAGRFQLPLPFAVKEDHTRRVSGERVGEIRKDLAEAIAALDIKFTDLLDDLDTVTVADDLPFGYTLSDPEEHPGAYTVDDALARNEDRTRWGFVGRLAGGPVRSVYMAMAALFLQPEKGLFFSRYDPKNRTFGVFDPLPALETMKAFFPVTAIRHPDATLARWREIMWPRGNRYGFLYVNSSGGATSWSTSRGKATPFDVPDTVPAVVHYTHSGSAGRPFDADTIAGRWLANGAYVYFGSHAEPYLQSFVPPKVLAERVKAGLPLGAAMRLLFSTRYAGHRPMKVKGKEQVVFFNMSGPWKLAYFGDPSYRITGKRPARAAPTDPGPGYYSSVKAFVRAPRKTASGHINHELDTVGIVLLDPKAKKLVDKRRWSTIARHFGGSEVGEAFQIEMLRVWIASLDRENPAHLYDPKALRKLSPIPEAIKRLAEHGNGSPEAGRRVAEFAKGYVTGIAAHPGSGVAKDPKLARWALEAACSFAHSKVAGRWFFAWVREACGKIGVEPSDLRRSVLDRKWLPGAVRDAVGKGLRAGKTGKPGKRGKR